MPVESRDPELEWVRRSWEAQPPTAGFHNRVLAAYVREAGRVKGGSATRRKRMPTWMAAFGRAAAVAILAGAALLAIVAVALPQTGGAVSPPWTVDSEFLHYDEEGSPSVEMYMTSYSINAAEILLSKSVPGDFFRTVVGRALQAIGAVPVFVSEREEKIRRSHLRHEFITRCGMGCLVVNYVFFSTAERQWTGCLPGPVVGREQILGHPTEAVRAPARFTNAHERLTLWTAADLGCFALKVTYEEQMPDGKFRLVSEKRALRVNMSR
jgi:hypothetical protein